MQKQVNQHIHFSHSPKQQQRHSESDERGERNKHERLLVQNTKLKAFPVQHQHARNKYQQTEVSEPIGELFSDYR